MWQGQPASILRLTGIYSFTRNRHYNNQIDRILSAAYPQRNRCLPFTTGYNAQFRTRGYNTVFSVRPEQAAARSSHAGDRQVSKSRSLCEGPVNNVGGFGLVTITLPFIGVARHP